jgi:hypothetical protein
MTDTNVADSDLDKAFQNIIRDRETHTGFDKKDKGLRAWLAKVTDAKLDDIPTSETELSSLYDQVLTALDRLLEDMTLERNKRTKAKLGGVNAKLDSKTSGPR